MKNLILSFVVLLGTLVYAPAQNASYEELMGQTLSSLQKAASPADWLEAASRFERLGAMSPSDWLPAYYSAFTLTNASFVTEKGEDKDKLLDRAQTLLEDAIQKKAPQDETLVLQALIHQARIGVSPMARGMKYSGMAEECLAKAEALNPNNPRAPYLRGQNIYNTPKMFGGGKENALPLFKQAEERFAKAQPSPLYPSWGRGENLSLIEACKQ